MVTKRNAPGVEIDPAIVAVSSKVYEHVSMDGPQIHFLARTFGLETLPVLHSLDLAAGQQLVNELGNTYVSLPIRRATPENKESRRSEMISFFSRPKVNMKELGQQHNLQPDHLKKNLRGIAPTVRKHLSEVVLWNMLDSYVDKDRLGVSALLTRNGTYTRQQG